MSMTNQRSKSYICTHVVVKNAESGFSASETYGNLLKLLKKSHRRFCLSNIKRICIAVINPLCEQ